MKFSNAVSGFGAILAFSLAGLSAARADEAKESVDNAFTLCRFLDRTGSLSEPCHVSGWNASVTISVDSTATEAVKLCPAIKQMLQENQMKFGSRWTMKVTSPYSGDKAIATCRL